ncbi:MAG: hypothetical protein JRI68_23715, partial [Deltaproteobacteria bacterium]|nr:hypothetical protein [Deltaproteobacteria bacterium]
LNDNCCASFDPCVAEVDCKACLQDPDMNGCDTNTLFETYNTCRTEYCPSSYCDTGIGLYIGGVDPVIECNLCINGSTCCDEIIACVGDESQAAKDMCVDCLNGETSCTDTTIQTAADDFTTCKNAECQTECNPS